MLLITSSRVLSRCKHKRSRTSTSSSLTMDQPTIQPISHARPLQEMTVSPSLTKKTVDLAPVAGATVDFSTRVVIDLCSWIATTRWTRWLSSNWFRRSIENPISTWRLLRRAGCSAASFVHHICTMSATQERSSRRRQGHRLGSCLTQRHGTRCSVASSSMKWLADGLSSSSTKTSLR